MNQRATDPTTLLFVPADRLDRLRKANVSGADAVILDLEDGVSPASKNAARDAVAALPPPALPTFVRVNAAGTPEFEADLAMVGALAWRARLLLSKVESIRDVPETFDGCWALIESAAGLANARAIATTVDRLVFGSADYCADLGCSHSRDALLSARTELVLASRLAGLPGPVDGVSLSLRGEDAIRDDAAYAATLGFGAKLCVHPAQLRPARLGFCPAEAEIAWAKAVLGNNADGVYVVDGALVDKPVRDRALRILTAASSVDPAGGNDVEARVPMEKPHRQGPARTARYGERHD